MTGIGDADDWTEIDKDIARRARKPPVGRSGARAISALIDGRCRVVPR